MSGAEIFLYVGAGAGWGGLIGSVVNIARDRAYRADYRRAESIAGPAIKQLISDRLTSIDIGRPSHSAKCAVLAAEIDVTDLALLDRFSYSPGFKDLVQPRLEEVRAWQAKRRSEPVRRLAAFVRSAAIG